jgi:hypothetical protein
VRKLYIHIIILATVALGKPLFAQEIIVLDSFEPYERISDTIYFNRNNYDFVITRKIDSTRAKKNRYITQFYILKDLQDLRYKLAIPRYTYKYQLPNNTYTNDKTYGYATSKLWRTRKPLKNNCVKITTTKADHYLQESSILLPGEKKDTSKISTSLSADFFPELKGPIDSMYSLLHFGNMEYYTIYINHNDSTRAYISFTDICNPINHTQKKILTRKELNEILKGYIDKIRFPELKLEKEIISYQVQINLSYDNYSDLMIRREKTNGFKNSIQIFPDNDSLFAIVDSFSNRTVYFNSQIYDGGFMGLGYYIDWGIKDFGNRLIDVSGDGRSDLILDTTFYEIADVSSVGDVYSLNYIHNYAKGERINPQLVQTIQYSQDLGNSYYYLAKNRSSASIFCIHNNKNYLILDITNDYMNHKGKNGNQYYTHIFAHKRADLTQSIKFYSKQGISGRESMTRLIQYYKEHPEKLPVDFPMN